MKKFLKTLIAFLFFIILFPLPASATFISSTFYLPALGVSVEVPFDYHILTHETEASSPVWDIIGWEQADMLSFMTKNHLYMDLIEENFDHEITVSMEENDISNFNDFARSELEFIASTFATGFAEYGMQVEDTEIYEQGQAKFIKVLYSVTDNDAITYVLQYYTVYNYKAINFRLFSYSGNISSKHETIMQHMIDRLDFGNTLQTTTLIPVTSGYVYNDPESNAFFSVPNNWTEKPLTKQREIIDAKFASYDDPGIVVLFSCTDLWLEGWTYDERAEIEASGITRYDLDFDVASILLDLPLSIPDMYDSSLSPADIRKARYGNCDFYIFETVSNDQSLGIELNMKITLALTIQDGYFYMFYFSSTNENPLFSDYEAILKSFDT
ncbi:MAG: hypothetical protein IKJ26_01715 [Clostridia bacterium]|nr:hypothetical protein [Clostridia bacterium]